MRSIEQQRARILAEARMLEVREIPLAEASGFTLAEPVRARVPVPAWDNSSMDGFAVRFSDVEGASENAPVTLRVVADIFAGSAEDPPLRPGEAARIMTGAPLPTAADTVVPFESTRGGLADSLSIAVVLDPPQARGMHVRRRGEDVGVADVVVPTGEMLGPLQRAAGAACGVDRVRVRRAPRVAVLSTGTELAPPGAPLTRGLIPESNSVLLEDLVTGAGADVVLRATVDDTDDRFVAAIEETAAVEADVVVTSGGVSAGAFEVVRSVLTGSEVEFGPVAMQPGKPQGFGRLPSGALVFALPGNPVSAAVSFEVFVRPALLAMQGRVELDRPLLRLSTTSGWRSPVGRRQFVPVRIDRTDANRWSVAPATAGGSGSHLAGGLARAEAYAVVAEHVDVVSPGDVLDVMLIG